MDLTISGTTEWALMTETRTGRTALCIPRVNGETLSFRALAWFPSYDDAFAVIAALEALDMTVDDVYDTQREERHEQEEATAPDDDRPVEAVTAAPAG